MNEELAKLISSYKQKGLTDDQILNNLRNTWLQEDIINELKNSNQETVRSTTETTIVKKKRLNEPFTKKQFALAFASIILLLMVGLVMSNQIQNKNNYNVAVATAEKRYNEFISKGFSSIESPTKHCDIEYQGFNSGERCEISFQVNYDRGPKRESLKNIAVQMGFEGSYNSFYNPENYKEYFVGLDSEGIGALGSADENVKTIQYSFTYKHL